MEKGTQTFSNTPGNVTMIPGLLKRGISGEGAQDASDSSASRHGTQIVRIVPLVCVWYVSAVLAVTSSKERVTLHAHVLTPGIAIGRKTRLGSGTTHACTHVCAHAHAHARTHVYAHGYAHAVPPVLARENRSSSPFPAPHLFVDLAWSVVSQRLPPRD